MKTFVRDCKPARIHDLCFAFSICVIKLLKFAYFFICAIIVLQIKNNFADILFAKIVDFGGITIYNLIVERRDNIKAKKLRSKGIVPASIYGRNLEESILIQIPQTAVNSFLGKVSKGQRLTLELDGKKYNVIYKNITREPIRQQIEQIEFQHIVADEAVNSVVKVVLINRDKNQNIITQLIEEIPYNALPKNFVDEVVIDLDGIKAGSVIKIEDLDIIKNENIRLTIPEDTVVLTVAERKRAVIEEKVDEEQGA